MANNIIITTGLNIALINIIVSPTHLAFQTPPVF